MRDNHSEVDVLWKWTCPFCEVTLRTRSNPSTADRARQHLWTEHRSPTSLIVPQMCMWDPRIKGHVMLVTYEG